MAKGQSQNTDLGRLADSIPQLPGKLDDVYLAVATLFEQQKAVTEHERQLATDILRHLSKDV